MATLVFFVACFVCAGASVVYVAYVDEFRVVFRWAVGWLAGRVAVFAALCPVFCATRYRVDVGVEAGDSCFVVRGVVHRFGFSSAVVCVCHAVFWLDSRTCFALRSSLCFFDVLGGGDAGYAA